MTALFLTGIQSSHIIFYPGSLKLGCTQSDRMKTSLGLLEVLRRDIAVSGCEDGDFTLKEQIPEFGRRLFASMISWPFTTERHLLVKN